MTALVLDQDLVEQLIEKRRQWGADKHDEVWDEVYVTAPLPNNEHQELIFLLGYVLHEIVHSQNLGVVYPGVNVTDREENWRGNYRCPDVVVFLNDTKAKNCDTHWVGGPDFLIEIISEYDKTREKLGFYEQIGTREILLVDHDPWQLELYQLRDDKLVLAGKSTLEQSEKLVSAVVPLTFCLDAGEKRPQIKVVAPEANKEWTV